MDWSSGLWWKFNDANVTLLGEDPRHLAEDDRNDANDAGNDANGVTDRDDEEGDEKDSDDEEFQPTNGGGKRKGAKKGKGNAKKKQKTTSSKAKPTAADTMRKGKGKKGSKETRKGSIKGNGSGKGKVSLGSEDAYVLMYVCKDYLLKHARLVTSKDPSMLPSESLRSLVAGENIELRRGDDRVRQKSDNVKKMIARRKELVREVLECNDNGGIMIGKDKNSKAVIDEEGGECEATNEPIKLLPNSDVIDVDITTNGTIDAKADEPTPAGLPGTSECNNLQLCCQEHGGMGLHPRTLHKCKILSPETYEKLNKAVHEETGNPEHSFENFSIKKANFRCLECEKNYKRTLTETIAAAKKWHGLIATLNSPEANIKHPENLDVGETNVVASSFISAITSNFNRICAACIKDPAT
ncbi:hypothetical protein TrCOL_g9046, partial [Triparma columacea]